MEENSSPLTNSFNLAYPIKQAYLDSSYTHLSNKDLPLPSSMQSQAMNRHIDIGQKDLDNNTILNTNYEGQPGKCQNNVFDTLDHSISREYFQSNIAA